MITDPTDIATLRAWYDASDSATITKSGSNVTAWADKSGFGNDLTSAGTITVAAAHQNGLDTLRIPNSSSNHLDRATSGLFGGVTDERSYAFVVRFESLNPGLLLTYGTSSGNDRNQVIWLNNNTTGNIAVIAGSGSSPPGETFSDTALATGDYYILIVTISVDAGTGEKIVTYSINGAADTPADVTLPAGSTLIDNGALSIGHLGTYNLDAYVAEAVLFNSALTSTEIADLYDYFYDKWFVAAPSDSIALTDFADRRVMQRPAGQTSKQVTIAGTYTGSPISIEARVVEHGTSTVVVDWTTIVASPSGGAFSGALTVAQGGWYNVQVRFGDDAGVVSNGSNRWGIGVTVFMIGQSNMDHMKTVSSSPPTANTLVAMFASSAWAAPTGNGLIALGNALAAALSLPIGLIDYAVSGTAIDAWDPGSAWTTASAGVAASGGDCEFVLWHQGEQDAINGTSKSSYKASLAAVYTQCRSVTGRSAAELPFMAGLLGVVTDPPHSTETDATWQAIQDGHLEFCAETNGAALAGSFIDLAHADDLHYAAAAYETFAARCAQTILFLLGEASYSGAGPRLSSATISGTTLRARIAHDGGGDFTPTTGITGFEVLDDGAPLTVVSAARQDANTIALELGSEPAGAVTLRYQYGESPDITGLVQDDSGLALPLLYISGLAVSEVVTNDRPAGADRLALELAMRL
jgi:Carbohydrate esterase, sialic acid-specific acetylesterase